MDARNKAINCPITLHATEDVFMCVYFLHCYQWPNSLYLRLNPCSHSYSASGLHPLFQAAVQVELKRLRTLYPHLPPAFFQDQPPLFDRKTLLDLRARTTIFRPKFNCPYCTRRMRGPPALCRNLSELGHKIKELAASVVNSDDEPLELPSTPFPCTLSDYFVFFDYKL
jgi:hypothetical protein